MPAVPRHVRLDAAGQPFGRLASTAARYLRGKHLLTFAPNRLPGVHVTVTNLSRARLGARPAARPVHHFSGYPGGLTTTSLGAAFATDADATFRRAVKRMLPANRLRQRLLRFLHTNP